MPRKGDKEKEAECQRWCERAVERCSMLWSALRFYLRSADTKQNILAVTFRFIGTSRNIVGAEMDVNQRCTSCAAIQAVGII